MDITRKCPKCGKVYFVIEGEVCPFCGHDEENVFRNIFRNIFGNDNPFNGLGVT